MKKIAGIILLSLVVIILSAYQASYIRDVQGGTVSPSSTAEMAGLATQRPEILFDKNKACQADSGALFF